MNHQRCSQAVAMLVGALLVCARGVALAVPASTADDICAPTDDPCVITQSFEITNGAVLDFGTRAVEISGNGRIDTGAGDVTLICGQFTMNTGQTPGLKVRGSSGGVINGGTLSLLVQRRCSLDQNRACLSDAACGLGTCSVRVCSADNSRACISDENCNFGTCSGDGTCSLDPGRACENDADCSLGTCAVDVCSADRTVQCGSDADCNLGTCSIGDGSVTIERGPTNANGVEAGSVFIRAAADVTVSATINANGTTSDSDGGVVEIESGSGSVTLNSTLSATSGGLGTGGDVALTAGQDVRVNAPTLATGGDFDGGFVEFTANRDVVVNQAVDADSNNGGGFGGEITVSAGRDILANAPSAFSANGNFSSIDNFGGDGGSIELTADGALTLGGSTTVIANGSEPDGFGGDITLTSGGAMALRGSVVASAGSAATQGGGGSVDVDAGGALDFPSGGVIDVRGFGSGGGDADLLVGGGMTFAGRILAQTTSGGTAGSVFLDVDGDVDMTGSIDISGTSQGQVNGLVDFEFCRLDMLSTARIQNDGAFGRNTLRARERVTIASGATVQADAATGVNRIIVRDPNKPPQISGTVSPPAAPNDVDPNLAGCPVCGNGELDGGETCEDGNTVDGDGCSSDCQDEACIAQTPGYPDVPLCDDGNGCTVDRCENSNCRNEFSCDDGIDCTEDVCTPDNTCENTPNDALCDDANPCTDDLCSLGARGCVISNNVDPCDDGLACTIDDRCAGGVCSGTPNCPGEQVCSPTTGQCEDPGVCGDGTVDQGEQCDDGDTLWSPGEFCDAGCEILACGDPDDNGAVRSSDALFILRAAVGAQTCDECVCNVDSSTGGSPISASDSLRVLRKAVGIDVELTCPPCP